MRRFDPQRRATLHTPCTNTAYIPRKHPCKHTADTHCPHTATSHTQPLIPRKTTIRTC